MRISDIEFQLSRIPLPGGTWGDQIHTVTHIEIVTADITADDGSTGTGFTHTSGVGGRTILAMLEELRTAIRKEVGVKRNQAGIDAVATRLGGSN